MRLITSISLLITFLSCQNQEVENSTLELKIETVEDRQEQLSINIYEFIDPFVYEFDTIPYFGFHHTEAGILQDSIHIWRKNLVFKSKELITNKNGNQGYRRFAIKSFQYRDSVDCSNAFHNWLSVHNINEGKISFIKEPEIFEPEPTIMIKTKDQLVLLMAYCSTDTIFWNNTRNFLISKVEKIEYSLEFGCDSIIHEKYY